MNRREFLRKLFAMGGAAVSSGLLGGPGRLFAQDTSGINTSPDLVAVKGGKPPDLLDRGLKSFGGMQRFVPRGSTVVIKPNIGWSTPPERGANTHPSLVRRIIEHCYNAGAKKVYVFDHSCSYWKSAYEKSGIEAAAKDAEAQVAPGHQERYYHQISIPHGKILTQAKVHELILESDVFINVPILKHHGSTRITSAMKNLMGAVWDRSYYHRHGLHQCIADFCLFGKPTLNIIDAYTVMFRNGPRGFSRSDLKLEELLIMSKDIVAADSAAAQTWGTSPNSIEYIRAADEIGIGTMNLDTLSIERLTI